MLKSVSRLVPALFAAAFAASAQTPSRNPSGALDPSAEVPRATYQSSLAQYKRHTAEAVGSWKHANETVNRIGGWRTYAREAQAPEPSASGPSR